MKRHYLSFLLVFMMTGSVVAQPQQWPTFDPEQQTVQADWLRDPVDAPARLCQTREGYLVFTNGLVSRTFTLQPNVASVGLDEETRLITLKNKEVL